MLRGETIYVQETYVNQTENARFWESEIYDTGRELSEIGRLYRDLRREYGRCTGRVYRDRSDGSTMTVGWVFVKRMKYEDARSNRPEDYYIREVWVTCFAGPEETIRMREPLNIRTGEKIPRGGIYEAPGKSAIEVREIE